MGAKLDARAPRGPRRGSLPEAGEPPAQVVERLARDANPGIVASAGPRFFGFVVGGQRPGRRRADWLTTAGTQNAGLFDSPPRPP